MNKRNILAVGLTVVVASAFIIVWVFASGQGRRIAGPEAPIGGDKDVQGCLVAAGYSWCEAKQKCLRPWEEVCGAVEPSAADLDSIKQAFIDKYGKDPAEVQVAVSLFDGQFARGSVKFSMSGESGEGGVYLAYKQDGEWRLAFDGNGNYDCTLMENFGFPEEMIPDCARQEDAALGGVQLPNPASAHCREQGGELDIRIDADGGQYGVCLLPDGSECEEWAFYRGECETEK